MGRKPGSKNKVQMKLKEAIEASFDKVGGVEYLVTMAYAEPKSYLALLAKVLPSKIEAEISVFQGAQLVERLQQGRALAARELEDGHDEHRVH
jgi:hypothetical protein